MYGINTAMQLLRPNARWEVANDQFVVWEDPRPCPTMEEVWETMDKIKAFEDSINTVWRDDQVEAYNKNASELGKYL